MNSNSVDLIYLDPPFNKGREFHAPIGTTAEGADFSDIWTPDSVKDEWHNQINDKYPKLYKYLDSVGDTGSRSAKYYLIYMAVRLMESHRVLKDTGSIYLHCDPTASHYLKLLLDTIFGHGNFRNEVIWKRSSAHNSAKRFGPIHDTILFYSMSDTFTWNRIYQPYEQKYIDTYYKHVDKNGRRYCLENLTGSGTRSGESGKPWRGHNPTTRGNHWTPFRQFLGGDKVPPGSIDALDYLDSIGRIYWPTGGKGMPRFIRYLDEMKGVAAQDIITDISPISSRSRERMGYPTQKPIVLLERIIEASSNELDVILDPFCGCATTCIAAEKLKRQWIGIDVSHKAYDLVVERLNAEVHPDLFRGVPDFRTDIPTRTDVPYKKTPTQEDKFYLFGKQNSKCVGCYTTFEIQHLEIDHVIPQSQGGNHERDNLQLLCGHCNRVKGDRPMEYLKAKMRAIA